MRWQHRSRGYDLAAGIDFRGMDYMPKYLWMDTEQTARRLLNLQPNIHSAPNTMQRYFGLTGSKLHAAIWVESWVAISIFGYCSASAGGVLNMPAFQEQFPSIDVANAPKSEQHHRSTIQGITLANRLHA